MKSFRRLAAATVLVPAAAIGLAQPASAQPVVIDLLPGQGCADFGIRLEIGETNRNTREFRDESGNLIRILSTGRSESVVFTNLSDLTKTFSVRSRGTATKSTPIPGTKNDFTKEESGHFVLVLFPEDGGPSSTLFDGRVVWIDRDAGPDTLVETRGKQTDICAKLASS
jgi:hypothetical protein